MNVFSGLLSADNAMKELMGYNAFLYPDHKERAMQGDTNHWKAINAGPKASLRLIEGRPPLQIRYILDVLWELSMWTAGLAAAPGGPE